MSQQYIDVRVRDDDKVEFYLDVVHFYFTLDREDAARLGRLIEAALSSDEAREDADLPEWDTPASPVEDINAGDVVVVPKEPTDAMVERAARAIYARTPLSDVYPYTRWDELPPWVRDRLRRDARVALEAALSPEEGE